MRCDDDSMDEDAVDDEIVAFLFPAIRSRISRNTFNSSLGSHGALGSLISFSAAAASANCLLSTAILCSLLINLTIKKSAKAITNK